MATHEKRGDTYKITVSLGYDSTGKQIRKRLTWKPAPGMTPSQIKKELERQKVLFEEKCRHNHTLEPNMKFSEFVDIWLERHAKRNFRPITLERDMALLERILPALGHLKMCKIQPPHLLAFYSNLEEQGVRMNQTYKSSFDFKPVLKERNLTIGQFAELAETSRMSFQRLRNGQTIRRSTAAGIARALEMDFDELFTAADDGKLAERTILMHHVLVHNIMDKAVLWGLMDSNPCERVGPLKRPKMAPKYLDEYGCRVLLNHLEAESQQRQVIIKLLLYTGFRRGEVCGLEWDDIDFEVKTITIRRTLMYTPEQGTYIDEGKNANALRCIKVSDSVIEMLRQYKAYQAKIRLALGGEWNAGNRLFTHEGKGEPICPQALSAWFTEWISKKDDLPKISLHSLRHTNASLMIAANTPVTTVSQRLGHATPHTTMTVYAHAIKSADEAAAETLQDILSTKRA